MFTERLDQILIECVALITANGFEEYMVWHSKNRMYTYKDLYQAVSTVQEERFYMLSGSDINRLITIADYIESENSLRPEF